MSEHDGVAHLGDIETALRRERDIIQERFPDAPPAEVERLVNDTYADLLREAEVETHVLSLTRPRVVEQLRERGYAMHEPVLSDDVS
ncbi:three-helix bundle dimerization domain-containing protein [Dactylosporangium sp. NPDC051541]|uniref:three-helix bundle dimerization domain-containing protein n=1 Tax=Dactylosporangium sp. NPDC051541 TaxID=3363977 RepID=UPI00379E71B5